MALLVDGNPSQVTDLSNYESSIVEVAATEGIDLTAKLTVAALEVGLELQRFLVNAPGGQQFTLGHVAVTDGLKGMSEALAAVYPATTLQTCIVHLLRNSMDFVSWKDRKGLATALKEIYRAPSAEAAEQALTAFEASTWGTRYPAIGQSWRRAWAEVIPFFAFPDEVRRIIYTTNAIEALNAKLRRAVRTRGHFPTDEAATKLLYLVLRQVAGEWKMPPREWCEAKTQFAIMFDERFVKA